MHRLAIALLLMLALAACSSVKNEQAQPSTAGATASGAAASSTAPKGLAQITGFVFEDRNQSGKPDEGESRVAGQKITLRNPPGTDTFGTTTTGPDGAFAFNGLAAGAYRVTVILGPGYQRFTDNSFVVSVEAGGTAQALFGVVAAH